MFNNKIPYNCYDENEEFIATIYAENCKELLEINPNIKYVRGIDFVTKRPKWHEVREDGLFPYMPKVEAHRKEASCHRSNFYLIEGEGKIWEN